MKQEKVLDKVQLGNGYAFIPTPVWFSAVVKVPEGTDAAVSKLASNFYTVQAWLDTLYEAARRGEESPEMPNEIKEILWPELAAQKSAKPRKKQASEADSSTE